METVGVLQAFVGHVRIIERAKLKYEIKIHQMKIYTFFFQQVSLFSNFDVDFLKNHAFENCSFFIMQIRTIGNPRNAD